MKLLERCQEWDRNPSYNPKLYYCYFNVIYYRSQVLLQIRKELHEKVLKSSSFLHLMIQSRDRCPALEIELIACNRFQQHPYKLSKMSNYHSWIFLK